MSILIHLFLDQDRLCVCLALFQSLRGVYLSSPIPVTVLLWLLGSGNNNLPLDIYYCRMEFVDSLLEEHGKQLLRHKGVFNIIV